MKRIVTGIALAVFALLVAPAGAQDVKQKLAAAKEAAARNQQALRSYSWLEKTELSLKGEVKNTKVDMCKYGPDGKCEDPGRGAGTPEKKRGLKGRSLRRRLAR